MARSTFAGTAGDFLATIAPGGLVRAIPGTLTIWSAKTGGVQYTDLLLDGSPVSSIPVARDGQVPEFDGPDGVNEVWADAGGGSRVRLVPDIVGVLTGEDTAVSALVNAPASDTRSALDGLIAGEVAGKASVADVSAVADAVAQRATVSQLAAETSRATAAETSLRADIDAWSPTGTFLGTWTSGTVAAQGDQAVYDAGSGLVKYGWSSGTPSGSGDVPGTAAGWVALPDQTADPQAVPRIAGSVPGEYVTNLAAIPIPYPAPAPSTGWGHGGPTAGANSRVASSSAVDLAFAPAYYRRTFSAAASGVNFIYGTLDLPTPEVRYGFRMRGRASWAGRRLIQLAWLDAAEATLATVQSAWTPTVVPAGEVLDLTFVPTAAAPAGATKARVRYVVEVGGTAGSATPGSGDTIDGTCLMGVTGTKVPPFKTGDDLLGAWNGTPRQSTSTIYVPARTAPIPALRTVSRAAGAADFTSINDAVAASSIGDTVLILPGEYREQVAGWAVYDLHLIGVNKHACTIIDSSGAYSTPPLEIGSGSVRGLTIIEDHATAGSDSGAFEDQRAYSIHPDNYQSMVGRELLVEDCIIRNTRRAAIGCGLYQGTTVTVRNCDIWSGAPVLGGDRGRGAIYFHNRQTTGEVTTDQHIVLDNNRVTCDSATVFHLYDSGRPGNAGGNLQSVMDVLCINNTLRSAIAGAANSILGGDGFTADVTLHPDSRGNNVAILNAA